MPFCKAVTKKKGTTCKNHAIAGDYCWKHTHELPLTQHVHDAWPHVFCTGFMRWLIKDQLEADLMLKFLETRAHIIAIQYDVVAKLAPDDKNTRFVFSVCDDKVIKIKMKANGIFNLGLEFETLYEQLSR